jgi:hypothetical protein
MQTKRGLKKAEESSFQTIRIRRSTGKLLSELMSGISAGGWASIRSSRSDRVSQASVVEEALIRLRRAHER